MTVRNRLPLVHAFLVVKGLIYIIKDGFSLSPLYLINIPSFFIVFFFFFGGGGRGTVHCLNVLSETQKLGSVCWCSRRVLLFQTVR